MGYSYKQPKYYEDFRCIGGACTNSCCEKWLVLWTKKSYKGLIEASCPELPKELVESRFTKLDNGLYSIILRENGDCPFHNEKGLCDIQLNLGEKALSPVCATYPRSFLKHNSVFQRWCAASCPAVLELLCNSPSAMERIVCEAREETLPPKAVVSVDEQEDVDNNKAIFFRNELTDFFWELFSDKRRSISSSIILGALAAKHFSETAQTAPEKLGALIKDMRKQMNSPVVSKSIEEIKPNYGLKFKLANNFLVQYLGERLSVDFSAFIKDGALNTENYLIGEGNFNKAFEGREYALKNIIINMFLDCIIPFLNKESSIFSNYAYFAAAAASVQVIAAATGFTGDHIYDRFILAVSSLARAISHNPDRAGKIIKDLESFGIKSPAHIAILVK